MKPVTIKPCVPHSALTLCKNGVIYLPLRTWRKLFDPHLSVQFYYDPESRAVGIKPCKNGAENAVSITCTKRAMQIRCGSLFGQFGIRLKQNVPVPSLTRQGKTLVFVIPEKAMEGGK